MVFAVGYLAGTRVEAVSYKFAHAAPPRRPGSAVGITSLVLRAVCSLWVAYIGA